MSLTMLLAEVTVPTVELEVTELRLEPPSEKSSAATVIFEVPSALARAVMVLPPCLIRLVPLKSALVTTVVIWSRSDLNWSLIAVRSVVVRPVSEADRARAFICPSRSETEPPAEIATSRADWPRDSELFTESSESTWARWFWAIAQVEPSSFALATFRPVLIWFWAFWSWVEVVLRFSRATIAPTLVLTLFIDMT